MGWHAAVSFGVNMDRKLKDAIPPTSEWLKAGLLCVIPMFLVGFATAGMLSGHYDIDTQTGERVFVSYNMAGLMALVAMVVTATTWSTFFVDSFRRFSERLHEAITSLPGQLLLKLWPIVIVLLFILFNLGKQSGFMLGFMGSMFAFAGEAFLSGLILFLSLPGINQYQNLFDSSEVIVEVESPIWSGIAKSYRIGLAFVLRALSTGVVGWLIASIYGAF